MLKGQLTINVTKPYKARAQNNVPTFSVAPSGDNAAGTNRNRRTRQTDRLDEVIVCQRSGQVYYCDVPVIAVWRVLLMQHDSDASKPLHRRIRAIL